MKLNWRVIVPLLMWLVLIFIPVPDGLQQHSWWYFAMFAAVIVGLILEPIPAAAIGLIGVVFATVMRYVNANASQSLAWGLSGFANSVVWLIFAAFVFSIGYGKTGLGRRIALWLV
ncbi:MAG: anion permease, partial [Anaerolineales bacterium]|nr:anion permease [Anaerolineales bacterium]